MQAIIDLVPCENVPTEALATIITSATEGQDLAGMIAACPTLSACGRTFACIMGMDTSDACNVDVSGGGDTDICAMQTAFDLMPCDGSMATEAMQQAITAQTGGQLAGLANCPDISVCGQSVAALMGVDTSGEGSNGGSGGDGDSDGAAATMQITMFLLIAMIVLQFLLRR